MWDHTSAGPYENRRNLTRNATIADGHAANGDASWSYPNPKTPLLQHPATATPLGPPHVTAFSVHSQQASAPYRFPPPPSEPATPAAASPSPSRDFPSPSLIPCEGRTHVRYRDGTVPIQPAGGSDVPPREYQGNNHSGGLFSLPTRDGTTNLPAAPITTYVGDIAIIIPSHFQPAGPHGCTTTIHDRIASSSPGFKAKSLLSITAIVTFFLALQVSFLSRAKAQCRKKQDIARRYSEQSGTHSSDLFCETVCKSATQYVQYSRHIR